MSKYICGFMDCFVAESVYVGRSVVACQSRCRTNNIIVLDKRMMTNEIIKKSGKSIYFFILPC